MSAVREIATYCRLPGLHRFPTCSRSRDHRRNTPARTVCCRSILRSLSGIRTSLRKQKRGTSASQCRSGCVVQCQICNREVAGSNLSLGYFATRSTQPSIPPGSVNEYQLRLGRRRQVWLIPIADELTCGCAGKTVKSLENTCHT